MSGCTECPRGHKLQPDLAAVIGPALAEAGNNPRSGFPKGFTYRELAQLIYRTDRPTDAQLSAVRRVAARLLRRDEASKGRRGREGVELRRTLTPADRDTRAEAMRPLLEAREAKRLATPYPIDTGTDGIVTVPVEPVLQITDNGVALREVRP